MIHRISLIYILLWMLFMESTSTLSKKCLEFFYSVTVTLRRVSHFSVSVLYFSVTFGEGSCDGPFTLTPLENLTITHVTSTTASGFCQDLIFSGWDSINSQQREVCVKLIKNQLQCPQRLEYRVRDYDASPSKVWQRMTKYLIASYFLSIRSMYYLIASRLNILRNSRISVSYRENNTFIFLLFKKNHVNKLILFNGLITVLDCFFLQLNKTHN